MSGGWRWNFDVATPMPVALSFRYKLTQAPNYEADEFSEAIVTVDALSPPIRFFASAAFSG